MALTVIVYPWAQTRAHGINCHCVPVDTHSFKLALFTHTHTHTSLTVIVRPWTRIRLILLCFHTQPCLSSCVRGRAFAQVCYDSTHSLVCHRAPVDAHSLKFVLCPHAALSVLVCFDCHRVPVGTHSFKLVLFPHPALSVIVYPWAHIRLSLLCFHTQPCLSLCARGHAFV